MTKSRSPTKKRLWNAALSPATWSEPVASAAIAAVIVWPGSKGFDGEERAARGAGRDRHDHRLADGPARRPG